MTTIFSTGTWLSTVWDSGANSVQSGGIMGGLEASKKYAPGSIKSYLAANANNANALATITQSGLTERTTLAMQMGDRAVEKRALERFALASKLNAPPPPPPPPLDPVIYFEDGSTLDTVNNVLTMVSGKKINALTGADWVDPASILNLANGSYIDTANNIMYMPDGTKIDTITGLVISVSA
jgi:hypothetical protein